MEIVALKIPETILNYERDILFQLLSHEERKKVERLIRPFDSLRQLVATSFLRTYLCSKLQVPNKTVNIKSGDHGKPFLTDHINIHFNLSHSGNYVVCAFDTSEIGIDIEEMKERDMDAISYFFSPQEITAYSNKLPLEKRGFFLDLWTAKESFIKAIGCGFALDIAKFTVHFNETITVEQTFDSRHWHFNQYEIDPAYKLTVCALNRDFPYSIMAMEFADTVSAAEKLIV